MHYRSLFPRDFLTELERLQRGMHQSLDMGPNIRGVTRGFPALNVGSTAKSIEIYAFAPGVDPASLEVQLEKGILTIAGERLPLEVADKATVHIAERFSGRFRRVVSLPDDIDANSIAAKYRDGVLHVHIARREESQPRRIEIQ